MLETNTVHCKKIWGSKVILLILVWHAPLGVRSAKRRNQSPEWTILNHSYRLIQGVSLPQTLVHPASRWLHWATRRRHSALSFASSSAFSKVKWYSGIHA